MKSIMYRLGSYRLGSSAVFTVGTCVLVMMAGCARGSDSEGQSSSLSSVAVISPSSAPARGSENSTTTLVSLGATETTLRPIPATSSVTEDSLALEFPEPLETASAWDVGMICHLYESGAVACYEHNSFEASNGLEEYFETELVYVGGISDATKIVAGANYVCVVHSDGSVSCWRASGLQGDGSKTESYAPDKIVGLSGVVSISSYYYHTCVVSVDGEVFCWGRNSDGQLGNGSYEDSESPVLVEGIGDAVFVSTHFTHTCIVHADSTISCWGKNEYGQLGDRSTEDSPVPVKVLGVDDASSVFPGVRYTCYIHLNSGVSCWGNGDYGIFRDGNSYFESDNPCLTYECEYERDMYGDTSYTPSFDYIQLKPKRIPGLSNVTSLTTGFTACAILEEGSVECWGCLPDYGGCREGHYPEEQEG